MPASTIGLSHPWTGASSQDEDDDDDDDEDDEEDDDDDDWPFLALTWYCLTISRE